MTAPTRVVFVAANAAGSPNGNETTAARLARGLAARGVQIDVVRPDEEIRAAAGRLGATAPRITLVHGFHLWRTGARALDLAQWLGVPLVMSATGTDLARDAFVAGRAGNVHRVAAAAGCVVCGHADEVDLLGRMIGRDVPALVAPKAVDVPAELPAPALEAAPGEVVVLHPAHLRPVKNNRLAVDVARRVRAAGVRVRLLLLGEALDADYAASLAAAVGDEWERMWLGSVPHEQMGGYYAAADIVLNTSDSEGGSNAILEAMAHGRAVLASAIPGNVAYLGTDGTRGLTYPVHIELEGAVLHERAALAAQLTSLATDPALRERLGSAGREYVLSEHTADAELAVILAAYERALG